MACGGFVFPKKDIGMYSSVITLQNSVVQHPRIRKRSGAFCDNLDHEGNLVRPRHFDVANSRLGRHVTDTLHHPESLPSTIARISTSTQDPILQKRIPRWLNTKCDTRNEVIKLHGDDSLVGLMDNELPTTTVANTYSQVEEQVSARSWQLFEVSGWRMEITVDSIHHVVRVDLHKEFHGFLLCYGTES